MRKKDTSHSYFPKKSQLASDLSSIEEDGFYINHTFYLKNSDFRWISMVRHPVERWVSQYYYTVRDARGKKAIAALVEHGKDPCGCAYLEFDACIRFRYKNNCSMPLEPQFAYFCDVEEESVNPINHNPSCDVESAIKNLHFGYTFVGLTDHMEESVAALKKVFPRFFSGASKLRKNATIHSRRNRTRDMNKLTNTTMTGAISNEALKMLEERCEIFDDEMRFYREAELQFWEKVVGLGIELKK